MTTTTTTTTTTITSTPAAATAVCICRTAWHRASYPQDTLLAGRCSPVLGACCQYLTKQTLCIVELPVIRTASLPTPPPSPGSARRRCRRSPAALVHVQPEARSPGACCVGWVRTSRPVPQSPRPLTPRLTSVPCACLPCTAGQVVSSLLACGLPRKRLAFSRRLQAGIPRLAGPGTRSVWAPTDACTGGRSDCEVDGRQRRRHLLAGLEDRGPTVLHAPR